MEETQTLVVGEETVSGTKSAAGVYRNPKADAKVYSDKFVLNPEKGATKIILLVPFSYEEATLKKDSPNFLFVLKKDGKEFGKDFWSNSDVFNREEEHSGELKIEIDLKKFYSDEKEVKLEFQIHLECWLDESSWKHGAPKQKAVSDSADGNLEINLQKSRPPGEEPEISLDILPTHSPGKDLKGMINADWGNPYFLKLNLNNKSNNNLIDGKFRLFEDEIGIKDANLKMRLKSKYITVIISEDGATWFLIKDKKKNGGFDWYENSGGEKFRLKKTWNKIYKYYSTGNVADEFNFSSDLKTDEISVNVRPPDYKVNSMNLYNQVVDVKSISDELDVISSVVGGGGIIDILLKLLAKETVAAAEDLATAWGIEIAIGAYLISNQADEVLISLKESMDDPPTPIKKYANAKSGKSKEIRNGLSAIKGGKKKNISKIVSSMNSINYILASHDAETGKYWKAKLRSNRASAIKHHGRLLVCRKNLRLKIKEASKHALIFSNYLRKVRIKKISGSDRKNLREARLTQKEMKALIKVNTYMKRNKKKIESIFMKLSKSFKNFGESYAKI